MTKPRAIINRLLVASTILLLIIGSSLLLLSSTRLRILEATYNRGGAGACGTIPLYDRHGLLHEIPLKAEQQPEIPLYYGEAPLYYMGKTASDPNKPPDSCIYLDSFPPEEVTKAVAVYPLVLDSTLVSQIGIGESTRLKVTALVRDNFSGLDYSSQSPYSGCTHELARHFFCRFGSDCRRVESLDGEPDAQRKLPQRDRENADPRQHIDRPGGDAEHNGDAVSDEQGRSDDSEQGKNPRHQT
jgi:hypothetical protein